MRSSSGLVPVGFGQLLLGMDRDETISSHVEALIGFFLVYLKDFILVFLKCLNKLFQVGTVENSYRLEQSS